MSKALVEQALAKARNRQIAADVEEPAPKGANFSGVDFLSGFGRSVLENTREFATGIAVSPQTAEFDAKHDTLGLVTDLGTAAASYIAAGRALKAIKPFEDIVKKIDPEGARPFIGAGLREATRMAPVELTRNVLNQMVGDKGTGEMATESAINLGLGFGLAGTLGKLAQSGSVDEKLATLVPEAIESKNLQDKYRIVQRAIDDGKFGDDVEKLAAANNALNRISFGIRDEAPLNGRFVKGLEHGDERTVNRLFKMNSDVTRSQTVTRSESGLPTDTDVQGVISAAGLSPGWEAMAQFPRLKTLQSNETANKFGYLIKQNFKPAGSNTWLNKEAGGGAWVVARKLGGEAKNKAGDRWLLYKTTDVGRLNPEATKWKTTMVKRHALLYPDEPAKIGVEGYDKMVDLIQTFPLSNMEAAVSTSKSVDEAVNKFLTSTGIDKVLPESNAGIAQLRQQVRAHIAPAMFQFRTRPRAGWIRNVAKATVDDFMGRANAILYGEHQLPEGSLFRAAVKGAEGKGTFRGRSAIKPLIDALDDNALRQVWRTSMDALPFDEVVKKYAAGEIGEQAFQLLKGLQEYDDLITADISKLGAALNLSAFSPKQGHYMLSRMWKGDHRLPLFNEQKQLVFVASGKTAKQAQDLAKEIIGEAKAAGQKLVPGELQLSDRASDAVWDASGILNQLKLGTPEYKLASSVAERAYSRTNSPRFFEQRSGVGGFVGDRGVPFTKEELEESIKTHVQTQHRYMAELTAKHLTAGELGKLRADDPQTWNEVSQRINDMVGKPGPLAQVQNALVDKFMSKTLGKNSASKIVHTANGAMMHLQLGMLNAAFAVQNALTFMQTVLPEASYIMSGSAKVNASRYFSLLNNKYYDSFIAAGADGKAAGSVSTLSMPKLLVGSFQRMGNPKKYSQTLYPMLERAANEGVTDPRLVEEYVGQNSTQVASFRETLKDPGNYWKYILKVSEFMPAVTEKFSRGHAFVVGHMLGEEVLGLGDEALYRFAKEFTERTMYLYSPADRARILTGPLGSMFGLFKNWGMHYMAATLEYTGEAYYRNNFKPLLWQIGGTSTVGGLAATPMFYAAQGINSLFNDDNLMQVIYNNFGNEGLADAVYLGFPAFLGLSLSAQTSAPLADPARDASLLFSFVHWDRMKAFGTSVGNAWDQYEATGEHPAANSVVRDNLIRTFAPKTLYRASMVVEGAGIKSLNTGYSQFDDASIISKMLFSMGFNPVEIEKGYKVGDALWKNQNAAKEAVSQYGKAWADAQMNGDRDSLDRLRKRALAERIDITSVIKSANARIAKSRENMLDRQFSAEEIFKYRQVLGKDN